MSSVSLIRTSKHVLLVLISATDLSASYTMYLNTPKWLGQLWIIVESLVGKRANGYKFPLYFFLQNHKHVLLALHPATPLTASNHTVYPRNQKWLGQLWLILEFSVAQFTLPLITSPQHVILALWSVTSLANIIYCVSK